MDRVVYVVFESEDVIFGVYQNRAKAEEDARIWGYRVEDAYLSSISAKEYIDELRRKMKKAIAEEER